MHALNVASDTPPAQRYSSSRLAATTKKIQLIERRDKAADDMAHKGIRLPYSVFCDTFFPKPTDKTPNLPTVNPFMAIMEEGLLEKHISERFVSGLVYDEP